jgi:hypothetical protein
VSTSLPTWDEMSDRDKNIAMWHVYKRESDGANYAIEEYPAEYRDHPDPVALDYDEACAHAKYVVGSIDEVFFKVGGDEYERLMNLVPAGGENGDK